MPLSAILNGERVISTLMSDEAWTAARKAPKGQLLMTETRSPGTAKLSQRGLRYFAHRPGFAPEGGSSRESIEHLTLKSEVLQLLAEAGWSVDAEVPSGPDRAWVADVLAEKDGRRIAFEVQWSRQALAEYARRSQRYLEDGVESVWIVRHEPNFHDALWGSDAGVLGRTPVFYLVDPQGFSEHVAESDVHLADYMHVRSRGGSARNRPGISLESMIELATGNWYDEYETLDLKAYTAECWRCGEAGIYWRLDGVGAYRGLEQPEDDPRIRALVEERVGAYPEDYARLEVRLGPSEQYMGFCCPHCGALQGASHEEERLREAASTDNVWRIDIRVDESWRPFAERWQVQLTPHQDFILPTSNNVDFPISKRRH